VQQRRGLGIMNDNEIGFFKQRLQPRDVLLIDLAVAVPFPLADRDRKTLQAVVN
jgi:hypothetical protein